MDRKKELVKSTAILMIGNMCTRFLSFLLLPLYTAIIETAEYGTFDLLISYASLFIPFVNWQLDQAVFRFVVESKDNQTRKNSIFSNILIFNVIQCIIFSIAISIIELYIEFYNLWFLIGYVVLNVIINFFLQFIRGIGNHFLYSVINFVSAAITIISNILFLIVFKMGFIGLFIASNASNFIVLIVIIVCIRPSKFFKFSYCDKKIIKDMCKYSVPLIPNNIAWWVISVSDRTIVSYFLGVEQNGIYTVANKFSMIFIGFYNVVNMAWTESVSLHFEDNDRDVFLSEIITIFYRLFCCGCLCITATMPFIFPIMIDVKYDDAYNQILILLFAMLMQVIVGLYSTVYIATKDTYKIAMTSALSALINIVSNLILVNYIGLYAASLSTFLAFGTMALIRYIDINKIVKMKISKFTTVSSIILAFIVTIAYYLKHLVICGIVLLVILVYSFYINRKMLNLGYRILKAKFLH